MPPIWLLCIVPIEGFIIWAVLDVRRKIEAATKDLRRDVDKTTEELTTAVSNSGNELANAIADAMEIGMKMLRPEIEKGEDDA